MRHIIQADRRDRIKVEKFESLRAVFLKILAVPFLSFLVVGCASNSIKKPSLPITPEIKQEFRKQLRAPESDKRELYEKFLPQIGVQGILDGIETVWPHCHSEAHDLGKVIFSKVHDVSEGLRLCDDRCHSGCMHGVLMEAFASQNMTDEDTLNVESLRPMLHELCTHDVTMASAYSPGDCAHGVGHALMMVTDYAISHALNGCAIFEDEVVSYYCSTGAYMEYVNTHDEKDAQSQKWLYPCDVYDYPAACARYKMVHVLRRHYQAGNPIEELKQQCRGLEQPIRLGCFHGLGNAHVPYLARGFKTIDEVCDGLDTDEESVCIEGAIERLAKYHEPRARQECQNLHDRQLDICEAAVKNKMYSMKKDMTLYLSH